MKTYNFSATVNYPDDEVDTSIFYGNAERVGGLIRHLLDAEPDATSFVITIVVNQEKKE